MRTVRQILLTEYMGAILVGVLIADAVSALVVTTIGQIFYYLQSRNNPVFRAHRPSAGYALVDSVVRAALFLLVAYLIARWLYPANAGNSQQAETQDRNL
jgi:hypothetical protein